MKKTREDEYDLKGEHFLDILAQIAAVLASRAEGEEVVRVTVHIAPHHRLNRRDEQLLAIFKRSGLPMPSVKLIEPQQLRLTVRPRSPLRTSLIWDGSKKWLKKWLLNARPVDEEPLHIQDIVKVVQEKIRILRAGELPARIELKTMTAERTAQVLAYFGEDSPARIARLRALLPLDESAKLTTLQEFKIVEALDNTTLSDFKLELKVRKRNPHYILRLRWSCNGSNGSADALELSAIATSGITLGRDRECDYVLNFPCISGSHLNLKRWEIDGILIGVEVEDTHSANGTYLKTGSPEPVTSHLVSLDTSTTFILGCGRVHGYDDNSQVITPEFVSRRIAEPERFGCVTVVVSIT